MKNFYAKNFLIYSIFVLWIVTAQLYILVINWQQSLILIVLLLYYHIHEVTQYVSNVHNIYIS